MVKQKEKGKSLAQFEQAFGGGRVRELQKQIRAMAEERHTIAVSKPKGSNSIRFAVIGDTHYGSLYEAKDEMQAFYELLADQEINTVLHVGDILDGHKIYKGQEFELHKLGWDKQAAWFADVAPRVRGIQTYFITGNHDESFKKLTGINVGQEIEHIRDDWHFLGEDSGRIQLETKDGNSVDVMLLHPDGGTAYALSYKPQKITEQIEGGTKPQVLLIGHFHKAEWMPSYRNTCVIQAGCFQYQTPFMVRKGSAAHVGGWIVEVTPQTNGNIFRAEFVAFYNMKK